MKSSWFSHVVEVLNCALTKCFLSAWSFFSFLIHFVDNELDTLEWVRKEFGCEGQNTNTNTKNFSKIFLNENTGYFLLKAIEIRAKNKTLTKHVSFLTDYLSSVYC